MVCHALLKHSSSLLCLAAGFFVHPLEDGYPIPASENCLRLLKEQLGGTYLYPVHRLDRATSGVVLYALSSAAAR